MITTSPFHYPCLTEQKTNVFRPLNAQKTGGIQPKLNAACFVQSCLTDADFVLFSNYCLIGTRLFGWCFWSGRRGSNSLPGIPRMAVAIRGSPASPQIKRASHRSRQRLPACPLSHSKRENPILTDGIFSFGAGDEARTRYLDLGKVALYQMSYARKRKIDYTCVFRICQALICIFCILFCTLCAPCAAQQHLNDAGVPRIRVEIHRPWLLALRLYLGLYPVTCVRTSSA